HLDQLDERVAQRLHLDSKLGLSVAEQNRERDRQQDLHVEDRVPRPAGRRAHCLGHARSFSCGVNWGWRSLKFGDFQTMSPTPDAMSSTFTASSNCRSENRLKMRSPNHAPSRAAGMKSERLPSVSGVDAPSAGAML